MSEPKKKIKKNIINICTAAFVIMLVLKVTNVMEFSWWWLAAPLLAPLAAFIAIVMLLGLCFLVLKFKMRKKKKK